MVPALKGLDEMSEDEMYFDINPGSVAKLLVSLIRHDIAETPTEVRYVELNPLLVAFFFQENSFPILSVGIFQLNNIYVIW